DRRRHGGVLRALPARSDRGGVSHCLLSAVLPGAGLGLPGLLVPDPVLQRNARDRHAQGGRRGRVVGPRRRVRGRAADLLDLSPSAREASGRSRRLHVRAGRLLFSGAAAAILAALPAAALGAEPTPAAVLRWGGDAEGGAPFVEA